MENDEIMRIVRYSTAGSNAIAPEEWCAFARALLSASRPAEQSGEPIYQIRGTLREGHPWHDVGIAGYEQAEKRKNWERRIVYTAPLPAQTAQSGEPVSLTDIRDSFEDAMRGVIKNGYVQSDLALFAVWPGTEYLLGSLQDAWVGAMAAAQRVAAAQPASGGK